MTKAYTLAEPFAQVESDLDLAEYTDQTPPADALAKRFAVMFPEGMPWHECAAEFIKWERNLALEEAVLLEEIKRLQQKKGHVENRREAVRDYLRGLMLAHGQRKFKSPVATATVSAGRERIVLDEWNIEQHIAEWPVEVVTAVVDFQPPKVSRAALARLDNDVLMNLSGVSRECGEDVLTIR